MQQKSVAFPSVTAFGMELKYVEIDAKSPENVYDPHVHDRCEIYLNLTGDVSFMVENSVYPVSPGDAVIVRPYEYHHCIYHSNALHKHFFILFSANGNERLFPCFFNRRAGENNLVALSPPESAELAGLCRLLLAGGLGEFDMYLAFFRMIGLLNAGNRKNSGNAHLPPEIASALDSIENGLSGPITIGALAAEAHMSVNTFERHFKAAAGMPPTEYIRRKRLAGAALLLKQGASVREAGEKNGFSDYSHFIAAFKRHFGVTPLKYREK